MTQRTGARSRGSSRGRGGGAARHQLQHPDQGYREEVPRPDQEPGCPPGPGLRPPPPRRLPGGGDHDDDDGDGDDDDDDDSDGGDDDGDDDDDDPGGGGGRVPAGVQAEEDQGG